MFTRMIVQFEPINFLGLTENIARIELMNPCSPRIVFHAKIRISEFVRNGIMMRIRNNVCLLLLAMAYPHGIAIIMQARVAMAAVHRVLHKRGM